MKTIKQIVLNSMFLYLMCTSFAVRAQFSNYISTGVDYVAGYNYQKYHTLEAGIALGRRGKTTARIHHYNNIRLVPKLLYGENKWMTGMDIGTAWSTKMINTSLNVASFYDFKKYELALRPELGVSFTGAVDLTYGFNFFFTPNANQLNLHVFTLRATFTTFRSNDGVGAK